MVAGDEVAVDRRRAPGLIEITGAAVADLGPARDQERAAVDVEVDLAARGVACLAADHEVAVDGRGGRVAQIELAETAVADLEAAGGFERPGSVQVVVTAAARVLRDLERDAGAGEVQIAAALRERAVAGEADDQALACAECNRSVVARRRVEVEGSGRARGVAEDDLRTGVGEFKLPARRACTCRRPVDWLPATRCRGRYERRRSWRTRRFRRRRRRGRLRACRRSRMYPP